MSRSSQTDARNNHRQTSACHHIHNPAEPPPATPTTRQTVKPRVPRHTQHDTSTDNPPASHHNHPHPNVTTYTTQHIAHPSTPTNEPTAPTHAPACTTRQTSAGSDNSLSRAALHPPNSVHHTAPQPPPTTTNQPQSAMAGNAGVISRRPQPILTTIAFGASLWNTLRYTSRRIYTLHVEALYWSFHGRTKCTYRTSM